MSKKSDQKKIEVIINVVEKLKQRKLKGELKCVNDIKINKLKHKQEKTEEQIKRLSYIVDVISAYPVYCVKVLMEDLLAYLPSNSIET